VRMKTSESACSRLKEEVMMLKAEIKAREEEREREDAERGGEREGWERERDSLEGTIRELQAAREREHWDISEYQAANDAMSLEIENLR
jgi:hypothetical protein